jgi:hypothetical protein
MSGRFSVGLVAGCVVLSLAAGEILAAGAKNDAIVSRIVVSSSAPPFSGCTPSSFVANVQAVSNDGVVGGFVMSKLGSSSCLQRVFRWNISGFTIVPFPPMPPNTNAIAGRIAVISTNNVTGGITFECQGSTSCPNPFEAATASGPASQFVINGWNYVFGISENGTWITGTNFAGQPLLYNVTTKKPVSLTLNGAPIFDAILSSASNTGLAVGYRNVSQMQNGMICITAGPCQEIDKGTSAYRALIKGISSDGSYIYGFHSYEPARNRITRVTKNSSGNYVVTETSLPFFMDRGDVTDKGTIAVPSGSGGPGSAYYFVLWDPKTAYYHVYSVAGLIAKLGLGSNVDQGSVALSPNGKYISFNVPVTTVGPTTLIGYSVYFENGIEAYLMGHLAAVKGGGGPKKK